MQPVEQMRDRIRAVLAVAGTATLVADYFNPDRPFAGTTFDVLGANPPGTFTLDDLLAVTLLDVRLRPAALRRILDTGELLDAELAAIPTGVDLWDAGADALGPATVLHGRLDGIPGIGPVIASKLLARKRPRLVPIHDEIVLQVLKPPPMRFWETLAGALAEPGLRDRIEALRPAGTDSPSLLRLLDVAIWTLHSGSRNARSARATAGVPDPAHARAAVNMSERW